jgi:hypothetical protein
MISCYVGTVKSLGNLISQNGVSCCTPFAASSYALWCSSVSNVSHMSKTCTGEQIKVQAMKL